jgi:hypothetical protein
MVLQFIFHRPWISAAIGVEQDFEAGAGLCEGFLFVPGQMLDPAFHFQGLPFPPDLLFENQFQGTASPEVFCAPARQMIGDSAFNIGGNARIQAAVAAF